MPKQPHHPDSQGCITLCAIAGPVMPKELGDWAQLAEHLLKAEKLQSLRGGYIPTTRPSLRQLRLDLSPSIKARALALEQERSEDRSIGCEALRGRARQALVLGQDKLFLTLFSQYGGKQQLGWHPDRDHLAFWDEVMGEALLDSDLLPAGTARKELFHLILRRYSLGELPSPLGLPTPPFNAEERLDAALYAQGLGDAAQLNKLLKQAPKDKLLQAIQLHHEGRFKEAQPLLKTILGTRTHGALMLSERRWDTLLPIAIRNAIQAKAAASIIECWLNYHLQCASLSESPAQVARAEADIAQLRREWEHAQRQLPKPLAKAQAADSPQKAIFWDLRLSPTGDKLAGFEARLLPPEQEAHQVGSSLALGKLSRGQYQEHCDADDLSIINHITEGQWSYLPAWHLSTAGYAALSAHPRVRLVGADGQRRALRLRIKTARQKQEEYQLQAQADGSYILMLPIQVEDRQELHALLNFRAQVLTLTLMGDAHDCQDFLHAQPQLSLGQQRAPFCWEYAALPTALDVLRVLHESGIPLLWQGSKPLQVHAPAPSSITLELDGGMGDWLKLGAELRVNEQLCFDAEQLLQLWQGRQGAYIPLSEEHYLALSQEQEKQLASLAIASSHKAGKLRVPRAAMARLSKAWDKSDKIPSALQRYREQVQLKEAVPSSITAQLRPYQIAGFEWLAARARCGIGCCLADEMGLGKSLQVLCLLQAQVKEGCSLIIAPLSLLGNWVQEAARFAPQLRVQSYLDKSHGGDCDVLIASYGQVLANPQDFEQEWNILVLDESQAIKNPRAQRSKAIAKLRAKSRVALSATPIENNLMELWSLMNTLNPSMLGSQRQFKQNTQEPEQLKALRKLIAPCMLRRLKGDVLQELPPLTEICVGVELDEAERALYESHRRQAVEMLKSEESDKNFSTLRQLTLMRRLCCHASLVAAGFEQSSKINKLVELAAGLKQAGHRALIFSQFTDVLQLAQKALEKELAARCLYLDGQLNAKQRNALVKRFQEKEAEDFFLISLKAGGTGLNLTAADYVILLDPWWNPAIEQQAMGRAHRMGQERAVTLCRLICHDTVEEKVLALHQTKKQLSELIEELPQKDLETLLD
ncbi:MAG: DEAD/DEAH box helicase [Akkermansia sp.]